MSDDSPTSNTQQSYGFFLRLKNQKLKGKLVAYSLRTAVIIWTVCTVLLLGGGIALLLASRTQVTIKARYDNLGPMADLDDDQRRDKLLEDGALPIHSP